jgi:hypothetical protein
MIGVMEAEHTHTPNDKARSDGASELTVQNDKKNRPGIPQQLTAITVGDLLSL